MVSQTAKKLVQGNYGKSLPEIENRLCKIIEEIAVDEYGMVRGAVHKDTLKPFTLKDMERYDVEEMCNSRMDIYPPELRKTFMTYEDADMATGEFLIAMLDKYQATGDGKALNRAKRTFRAIDKLCQNSFTKNPYGKGWLPKPHAGIVNVEEILETSVDQYCKITNALERFHDTVATKKQQERIEYLVCCFADWWIDRHYTATYYGRCNYWYKTDMPHAVAFFLYVLALAEHYGGKNKRKYREAFAFIWQYRKTLYNTPRIGGGGALSLVADAISSLVELKPEHNRVWKKTLRLVSDQARKSVQPDGWSRLKVSERIGPEKFESWEARFSRGVCNASAVVEAAQVSGKKDDFPWVEDVLVKQNRANQFLQFPLKERVPRRYHHQENCLVTQRMCVWLAAYWGTKRN